MGNKYSNILRLGIGLAIVSIILITVGNHGWDNRNWSTVSQEWLALFGWLFALGMGFVYFLSGKQDMLRNIMFASLIGISFSVVLGYMYDNGIYFDTVIIGNNQVWEVQLILVVIWVVVGIIKGVADNGQ